MCLPDMADNKTCVWCTAPTENKRNVFLGPRQVGRHGDADTFPRYSILLFPAYLILCNDIWRTYLVARHSDWVWACSPLHLRNWVEGVEFVPPAPPLSPAAAAASWTA